LTNDKSFESDLYSVNASNFETIALALFRQQAEFNPVYREYLQFLGVHAGEITALTEIPFLPISLFKSTEIKTGSWSAETLFKSSATTGMISSSHAVRDLSFYQRHTQKCFEYFFGSLTDYHFFALLPSYLERSQSSLVAMMDYFIRSSHSNYSGFYRYDYDRLLEDMAKARQHQPERIPVIWGVTFALVDLAEKFSPDLQGCMIIETGGMKGRRQELTRDELHRLLIASFGVSKIYSEYGMTELFSQAYTRGGNLFYCPPWMKVMLRDVADPFMDVKAPQSGAIKVIDLANWNTMAFIETEDSGRLSPDGSLEVIGRLDNTDIRGCNLMLE
jgi:hypothetical protein